VPHDGIKMTDKGQAGTDDLVTAAAPGPELSVDETSIPPVLPNSGDLGARRQTIPPRRGDEPGPRGPLELGRAGWASALARVRAKLIRDRVSIAAGSLAYHGFMALFPAVIALLGVITLARLNGSDITHIINGLDKALPPGASSVFTAAVTAADKHRTGSTVAVIVGTATAVWSSSSAMAALQQALDMAYEVPVDRKFLSRRFNGLPLMVATIVLGGLGASLVVFGASIGSGIEGIMPAKGYGFDLAWTVVRWLVTLLAVTALFAFFYYQGPNRARPKWQWVSVGGLVSTLVFVLASVGFSFYVSKFGSYGRTYGSFAGVAVLVFWMYLTALAVLIGGEINAELERQAAIQAGHPGAIASAQEVLSSTRPVPAHQRAPSP